MTSFNSYLREEGNLFSEVLMKKERKTRYIQIRATKTDVDAIKTAAKLRGITMSKLIRLAISEIIKEVKPNQVN